MSARRSLRNYSRASSNKMRTLRLLGRLRSRGLRPMRTLIQRTKKNGEALSMKFGAKCCRGEACSPATHCEADIREVVTWYRERDPALADRFLNEVHKTLAMLEPSPVQAVSYSGSERFGDGLNRQ